MIRIGPDEDGLGLVESVLALGVVGLVLAGALLLHRATLEARARATATIGALGDAAAVVETLRATGLAGDDGSGGSPSAAGGPGATVTPRSTSVLWSARPCWSRPRSVPLRVEVIDTTARVELPAMAPPPAPVALEVRVLPADGGPRPAVMVRATDRAGRTTEAPTGPDGCAVFAAAEGPVRLAVTGPDVRGEALVPLARGRSEITTVLEGALRVDVVLPGPAPDRIDDGDLGWWLVGHGDAVVTDPGLARAVTAGHHEVVVGVCWDARSGGSAAPVDVVAGATAVLAVPLGGMRVDRPTVPDGRRLVVQRRRPCPGDGPRPILRWEVGGGGGALVAGVPDGSWEVRMLDAEGRTTVGPVTVDVAGDRVVDVPW